MNYRNYVSGAVAAAALAAMAVVIPLSANAQTVNANVGATVNAQINPGGPMMPAGQNGQGGSQGGMRWGGRGGPGGMGSSTWKGGMNGQNRPAVVGKVTAINGDTLTVVEMAHSGFGSSTPAMGTTTFTVNASGATVFKNNATSSVSSIAVGDLVAVQGTVSGTSITATSIRDGFEMRMGPMGGQSGQDGFHYGNNASSSNNMPISPITGNGQPVIAGTISAINGDSLTITNKSNVTYTVDVTNAKIVEGQNTIAVSSLAVGDNVIVQGTVSGSSVTASSVIDQKANASGSSSSQPSHGGGIFGAIGGFFSRIFGF